MAHVSAAPALGRPGPAAAVVRQEASRDDWLMRACLGLIGLYLAVMLAIPLGIMLVKSLQDSRGGFVGLANYVRYFQTPALAHSIANSLFVSGLSTLITVPLAFVYAYALTRSCLPWKPLFKTVALIPILVPSLLPGLALVYLFGNQGLVKGLLFGHSIYGPIGIVMSEVFFTFPHALLIMMTALSLADARLYEAATALRASRRRIFLTVTLPGVRYGLISATFVVFVMVITDFGAPKVIGGQYNVLATDVYKQVIGQQNFEMGAVVSVLLLLPAGLAFFVDRLVQRRQVAMLTVRAVPYAPRPSPAFDATMLVYCVIVGVFLAGIIAVSQFGALVKFWPYNLTPDALPLRLRPEGRRRVAVLLELHPPGPLTRPWWERRSSSSAPTSSRRRGDSGGGGPGSSSSPCCPWRCPAWSSASRTSSSSTIPANPLNGLYRTMAILVDQHGRPLLHGRAPHGADRPASRWTRSSRRCRCRSGSRCTGPSGASRSRCACRRSSTSACTCS